MRFLIILSILVFSIFSSFSTISSANSWEKKYYADEIKSIEEELSVHQLDDLEKVKSVLKLAREGNPKAQFILALMYYFGDPIAKNIKLAINYFIKSGDQGISKSNLQLARIFYYGKGVIKNYKLAESYYIKASTQGNAEAMSELAPIYFHAYGSYREDVRKVIPENKNKALVLYKSASILGNTYAKRMLAHIYYTGNIAPQSYDKSFRLFNECAKLQGDAYKYVLYRLGIMHYYGLGTNVDYNKAFSHFEESLDKTDSGFGKGIKLIEIAFMYLKGLGVDQNIERAKELISSIKSSTFSSIGLSYCTAGFNLVKDLEKADIIFNILKDRTDTEAYYFLGEMYYKGYIKKDYTASAKYFKQAMESGHSSAKNKLDTYQLWEYL